MALRKRMKTAQPFLFSICVVLFFFGFIEGVLRVSGFEPTFRYRTFAIPAWMEELDPLVLEKYQKFVAGQGSVNEDAYAYRPDLRYSYRLKPDLSITVQNYSSALYVDKLPPWKIISNSNGFRVSANAETQINNSPQTLYVLGDSSSFGWGVDYEKSYPYVLAEKLNATSSRFRLKNLSLPGFSSFQGKLLWQELGDVKKDDWVILSFGWNDSYSSMQTDLDQYKSRNSLAGKISWNLKQVLMFRWMRTWSLLEPSTVEKDNAGNRVPLNQYRENLQSLVTSVRRKGAKPVLVSVCNTDEYRDVVRQIAGNSKTPFFNFPAELQPFLSTVNDRFPDQLVTYFEAYGEALETNPILTFLFPDRCHPNEIGHGLMAEVLLDTFIDK